MGWTPSAGRIMGQFKIEPADWYFGCRVRRGVVLARLDSKTSYGVRLPRDWCFAARGPEREGVLAGQRRQPEAELGQVHRQGVFVHSVQTALGNQALGVSEPVANE
jgi:hypothetical protein